ncbi:SHOCT domain-containing protein [Kribbia dieselivorans]|uniref:SHOCT domain-containing protein n=1 Tax=Kribbia dieselivorans TaxID=331526 RepID=UPI001FE01297|nr:SHOCT domain-containing protein [Kribbia dieselivorans]
MWTLMLLGTAAFWIVVVLVIRAMLPGSGPGRVPMPDPLDVLKERLARGDIGPEEYEQRRRLITGGH